MAQEYPRPFGKYTLLRPLARGGMGEIQLAAAGDVGGFEKLCVIKKVLAEHTDESKANRFLDEAKVVIRLSHTNLVSVFDVGKADGEFYIAMEFLEGHDLGAVWNKCAEKKARFPVDIALFIVREVCRGLAYAHTYGGLNLVHRDVTPPNIMISYFGEVKLTDFGLARSRLKQEFTAPGVVYGRLAYLAPEQARGTPVDARTDLYSVGIIMWELLTGSQLFRVSAADPVTAISIVRTPQVEPPSKRVPRLPASLDELVMKALAVSPSDRFQTAEDMRRAVGVELAAIAPTVDAERVASFMRMLYGEEIERERSERDHLLGRDRSGMLRMALPAEPQAPSKRQGLPSAAASGEVEALSTAERQKGLRTRTVPPSLVEVTPLAPRGERRRLEEPVAPTVRISPAGRGRPAPRSAPEPGAPRSSATPLDSGGVPAASRVGEVIDGRYRLKAPLGAGAMGAVYDAEHVDIGRRLAIKILHPQYSRNADLVARFRREARAASTIGDPHIVDVTDFGSTRDGCAYFVMERLEGHDLKELLIREHTMSVPRAVNIAIQVCHAVNAAHERGIIHRDLKPENIYLVTRESTPDFVKILDFGIAKSATLESADGRSLTQPGIAMGTPVYMAPEQATGMAVDARIDIYAVGTILYEMLTGVPPIDGDDVLEVLTRKATEDPSPPSMLNAAVPAYLDEVVMRALARDPAQRPQTLGLLEQELRRGGPRQAPHEGLLGMMVGAGAASFASAPPGPGPATVAPAGAPAGPGPARSPASPSGPLAVPSAVDNDETLVQLTPGMEPDRSPVVVQGRGARSTAEVRPLVEYVPPGTTRQLRRVALWPVLAMLVLGMAAGLYFGLPVVLKGRRTPVVVPVAPSGDPASQRDAAPVPARVAQGVDAAVAGPVADGGTTVAKPALSTEEVSRLLGAVRKAATARRYVAPAGDCVRDYLARIEEAQPGDPDAVALRAKIVKGLHRDGDGYLRRRKFDEAEATFRGMYGLNPHGEHAAAGLTAALLARSELELKRRRYDAAATDAKEAVALGDASGRGHLTLGEALLKKGAYHDAVTALRRAVEFRPKNRAAKKELLRAEKLAAAADKAAKAAGAKAKKGKQPPVPPPQVERRKGKE
jgi:eukaryotic-like serine/threonine-protein kinase